MTGLSAGVATLFIARLLLGQGERATFLTATKAMAVWLPPHRRAFAQGGHPLLRPVGNAVAPPLVGAMIASHGWRMPFYVLGAISLV